MLNVILNKNEELNILNGFPWVYNNEIKTFVCKVLNIDHKFVAYGFLNTSSKIMVRILSLNENDKIDKEFFKERIKYAISHRLHLGWSTTRLVFSEADFLPCLTLFISSIDVS